ncbi:site-specific integrase [Burkholderia pseudomallei]|uniref:site-specific integrase n=1 Tax=Burkholderia pseudomallei TaxID=28450 RepID=UPI00052A67A5|nr:site-specific integrase [Burkholderia pseudomallei]AIV89559.1 phage integrase family protein [Burkholderia pseudomallei B03]AIV94916.1 phage integrase family protein [Burkholderia pseudomallei A79A]KGY05550.1 phage integrase family protein [Burkholderia pseudomallei A79D]KGY06506.1 phage integrase family protein [Burkholderia pseudomallei A79C]
MASIENRSRIRVTVRNRDDLTRTFSHNADKAIQRYVQMLQSQGLKPRLASLDDHYVVRTRSVAHKNQFLTAHSEAEAIAIKQRIESEQRQGLFIDYAKGHKTTLADLLIRYLRDEAPRDKSFEVLGYKINAWLEDAGLPRQSLAEIRDAHPNPCPTVAAMKIRRSTGTRVGQPSETSKFIRKPFAAIVPDDFADYIEERCQVVEPSTVDREIDIFSAVCHIAIDTWRIHVAKNPMDGVRRPRYYNERDRRLKDGEEARLLAAARAEDRAQSIALRLEQLMAAEREDANSAATVYRRKQVIKDARQRYQAEAEHTYEHIPMLETFIHFQLMTGARRSETLTLTWSNVNLGGQAAFLPETKNGRPRTLPLRSDLVELLGRLPRNSELVFPIGVDGLRKAWQRICAAAGLTGDDEPRIHDLRHEAISRVAEAGSNTPGGFSLVDLQHFSGHRDTRMLLRYAHLCAGSFAKRLDDAFRVNSPDSTLHRGRLRLKQGASVSLKEMLDDHMSASSTLPLADDVEPSAHVGDVANAMQASRSSHENLAAGSRQQTAEPVSSPTPTGPAGNVIRVDFARRVA